MRIMEKYCNDFNLGMRRNEKYSFRIVIFIKIGEISQGHKISPSKKPNVP